MWPKESISDRVPPHSDPAFRHVTASPPRTVKKPTPFGKYFLLERINVGGMAEVFRAKAFGVEGFERLVAVKRIRSERRGLRQLDARPALHHARNGAQGGPRHDARTRA